MRFALLVFAAAALSAQTFDAVSVTPFAPQDDDAPPPREPGSMVYNNISLKLLITAAYSVRPDQIDGPAWLDSERYDIVGKPPAGATKDQVPVMLQHLLVERFHINVQVEERQRPGYALVASRDGVKIQRSKAITGADVSVAADHVEIAGATVAAFAGMLASFTGRPVTNETGIEGTYDFRLNVTMAELKTMSPAVFSAIRELGLSLETRTTAAKYLIVSRSE